MVVPYFDLRAQYAGLRDEIRTALDLVCESGSFILGDEVAEFEKEFADYCEARYSVALNSGTSALHVALLAIGAGPDDEVITTPNTFIATAEAIAYTGARPVFVDIDPATGNIHPDLIAGAISSRTKAIVPVHLYGRPVDWEPIAEIAARHSLAVIEDACQAHGARYRGRRVGSLGRVAAFSFYPTKNLGAYGEGGALVTNDAAIASLTRALRDHGKTQGQAHDHLGFNYRMDGFQGAVLRVKLRRVAEWTKRRQELASLYRTLLTGSRVDLPHDDPHIECVYHLFVVYVDHRDFVRRELERRGVGTAIHYARPVCLQAPFAALGYKPGDFPNTERACDRALAMPLFPEMTRAQVEYAAAALRELVGDR